MTFDLIYPAILVFTLMIVGVVLTAVEFKQLEKKQAEAEAGSGADQDKK
jgi:hypothetical protein